MIRIATTAAVVALAGAAMVSSVGTAEARPGWHGYRGHYAYGPRYGYRRGRAGAAVAAGLAGALIGGAIIASQQPRYDYYGGPAYGGYPAYGSPVYGGYPGYGY